MRSRFDPPVVDGMDERVAATLQRQVDRYAGREESVYFDDVAAARRVQEPPKRGRLL